LAVTSVAAIAVLAAGCSNQARVTAAGSPESTLKPTTSTTKAKTTTTASTSTTVPSTTEPPVTEPPPPPPTPAPTTAAPAPPTTAAPRTAAPQGPADASPGMAAGWRLVAQDDFNGSSVDTSRWLIYNSAGNGGVGLRRPSAISQANGELRITGRGDVSGGLSWRGGRTYGRWEIRARADRGNGYAPAILLWPESNRWPIEGEIDIAEIPRGDRSETHGTVHWGADNRQVGHSVSGDFSQWHVFGVEWTPDRITFFLDGRPTFTVTNPAAIPRHPMNLAIQNDVGPFNWIPGRDASTPAEVSLRIDWVRIYSL
jgi:beta-glucanase (GH16 family)